jgi:type III secretion protein U
MAEKTEKATPKKLRDARKKGQVAKSQDFPSAFTFVIAIGGTLAITNFLYNQLAGFLIRTFSRITPNLNVVQTLPEILTDVLTTIFTASLPLMLVVAFSGMIVTFLIVGPVFSGEAIKFDLKRLNPVDNIKNKFKLKTLFELIKSILKIAGAIIIIYFIIRASIRDILATVTLPPLGAALVFSSFLFKVVLHVGIFFLVVAILDLSFQKKQFAKEMMMEKFEVKQEFKDTEGNPEIKGRRRQLFQEIAYQEGPKIAKRAKAIVTNPIHLAVALDYDESIHAAPVILTMGQGVMADAIIKEALAYNVPIMRNVDLAHQLFEQGQISDYIPEETFEAVAEILRWIEQLENR